MRDGSTRSQPTDANPLLKDIHDRMPVIIEKDDYDLWLDPGMTNPAKLTDLVQPFWLQEYPPRLLGQIPKHSNSVESVFK